jgi:hypothetical protein
LDKFGGNRQVRIVLLRAIDMNHGNPWSVFGYHWSSNTILANYTYSNFESPSD